MSHSSMTLKNVMGGCELVDLEPQQPEESLPIDLSLIGVNLHELQKTLFPCLSHLNSSEVESVKAGLIESEFAGENCCGVESNDNNNNNAFGVQRTHAEINDKVKIVAQSELSAEVQCMMDLFDLNANDVEAGPNDSLPAFTSIQNFYETFDVSDQIESMTEMETIATTPSSTSTIDSSYEQDLLIHESPIDYYHNLEATPTVTSMATELERYELYFIPSAVNPQDSTQIIPLFTSRKSTKRSRVQDVDNSNDSLEPKAKKKPGRTPSKKGSVEKNISCSRCNKKFRTEAHLKVHFMVHKDSECVHRCTICERRFCHRGALALHARKHSSSHSI